ncbi:phenylalanine--tRNA ligase subunit beta [Candidatus Pacearchaeota archaeon]|nr:phenylalanine--tRNA ligase subunit beta [Candidatus Pacearchaeota archaeon]
MAVVSFNKKTFEKEIGRLNEEMQHKIAMFGTPLESVTDKEVQIEIFPNRPDLLSYQGFKRGFLAFLGKKTGLKICKIHKPEKDYLVIIDKSVERIRPYTACAIIKGLTFNNEKIKEIIDMQEKLHATVGRKRKKAAIGVYPLEKIKLPITYKALEPDKIKFIPLESEKEMSGLEILQKHPAGRNYADLLAGKEKFPIFIDANSNILSMPPIINSQLTGKITEQTKDVFIECSGFDFEILKKCLNIIATNLADMGGQIYQMELRYKYKEITPDLKPEKMKLNINNANKLLGLKLKEQQVRIFLEKMGYNYTKSTAIIPAWRTDILHEVDLIEDIAIAYGYDKLIPEVPNISAIGQQNQRESMKNKVAGILTGLNLIEISNYHLTTKQDQFTKMGLNEKQGGIIEVEESKTNYNILRQNLTHYGLKILSENIDVEYPQRIFEIGKIFEDKNEKITEQENLCITLAPGNFTELKQILEYLGKMLETEIKLGEPEQEYPSHFIEGRVAEVFINNKPAGFLGEIHPKIMKNWKLKLPVVLLEIRLDEVLGKDWF